MTDVESSHSTNTVEQPPIAAKERTRFLELIGLTSLAVAQPTFDLLSKNAALFVSWRVDGFAIVVLALLVVIGPPFALWLIGAFIGLIRPGLRNTVHQLSIGAVVAVIAVEVLKDLIASANVVVLLALVVAAAAVLAVMRWRSVTQWLRFLSVAPAGFLALFLFASNATPLVTASQPSAIPTTLTKPARVIMIVMDEFPTKSLLDGDGNIDAGLYPNFARLANESTWFRNNTTVAPLTEQAVPAILTGRYPTAEETLPAATAHPKNLFTLLGNTYSMNVHEAVTSLCPTNLCARKPSRLNVRTGFEGMVRDVGRIWWDFAKPSRAPSFSFDGLGTADPQALDAAHSFLATLKPSTKPRLDFLHLLLPHFPWHYLPTGQRYEALPLHTIGLDEQDWSSPWAATMGRQRHLLQVGATDRYIGELINHLKRIGEYDKSLIVITADHGVAFSSGLPFRGVAASTASDILWTPLFIKVPSQPSGRVDDRVARSIDVLPTIVAQLGADADWKYDGVDLFGAPITDNNRRLLKWQRNALRPKPGDAYLHFDGAAGFREVLAARAAPAGSDFLRLQRVGPYAALVGQRVADDISRAPNSSASLDQYKWYRKVGPFARHVPWSDVHGYANLPLGTNLAISINGTYAGVFQTSLPAVNGDTEFWGVLANASFKLGANDVRIYAVSGDPAAPTVRRLTLRT